MTRSATYTVTVRPVALALVRRRAAGDLVALLEGLRYEQARVVSWARERDGSLTVRIASDHFEPDRWASFGIYPKVLS